MSVFNRRSAIYGWVVHVDTFPPFYDSEKENFEKILASYMGYTSLLVHIAPIFKRHYFETRRQIRKTIAGAYNLSKNGDELTDFAIQFLRESLPTNEASEMISFLDRNTFYDSASTRFKLGKKLARIMFDNVSYSPDF